MNQKLHIALCEDNADDARDLCARIRETGIPATVDLYETGEAFVSAFAKGMYHLIFIDIYMSGISGIEIAEAIRTQDQAVVLVFVTTSDQHHSHGYRLGALKYIEKPVDLGGVLDSLTLAQLFQDRKCRAVLTIATSRNRHINVSFEDITHIDVHNHKCYVHTSSRVYETVTTTTIDLLQTQLPEEQFCRCHRSYIVNFAHVHHVEGHDFIMSDGKKVYIRERGWRTVIDAYNAYCLARTRE